MIEKLGQQILGIKHRSTGRRKRLGCCYCSVQMRFVIIAENREVNRVTFGGFENHIKHRPLIFKFKWVLKTELIQVAFGNYQRLKPAIWHQLNEPFPYYEPVRFFPKYQPGKHQRCGDEQKDG